MTGLHVVSKARKTGLRWYVYAWRGGPCIHSCDGVKPVITPEILDAQYRAKQDRFAAGPDNIDSLIADYEASPDFTYKRPATRRDYKLWLTRISDRFGKTPIAAFEDRRMRGDVIAWRNNWASQTRSADKASVMMGTLLSWAMENGRISVNVAAGIKQMHHVNKADQIWEDRHWQAVRAVKKFPQHVMDALELASLTGLRLGDLVRVAWEDVGDQSIILTTKKRGGRAIIPIYDELRKLLTRLAPTDDAKRTGPILLNSRGTPWTESGLGTVWQRRQPAGFDRTMHDLRGTFATFLALRGLNDQEIADRLGWSARKVSEIRRRYVDEARVVVSLVERLSA